jgi:hypothetical protein
MYIKNGIDTYLIGGKEYNFTTNKPWSFISNQQMDELFKPVTNIAKNLNSNGRSYPQIVQDNFNGKMAELCALNIIRDHKFFNNPEIGETYTDHYNDWTQSFNKGAQPFDFYLRKKGRLLYFEVKSIHTGHDINRQGKIARTDFLQTPRWEWMMLIEPLIGTPAIDLLNNGEDYAAKLHTIVSRQIVLNIYDSWKKEFPGDDPKYGAGSSWEENNYFYFKDRYLSIIKYDHKSNPDIIEIN